MLATLASALILTPSDGVFAAAGLLSGQVDAKRCEQLPERVVRSGDAVREQALSFSPEHSSAIRRYRPADADAGLSVAPQSAHDIVERDASVGLRAQGEIERQREERAFFGVVADDRVRRVLVRAVELAPRVEARFGQRPFQAAGRAARC